MPIFENKGVKYDVSPEYIPDFASEYPDAVTVPAPHLHSECVPAER
mgnify:FL=1